MKKFVSVILVIVVTFVAFVSIYNAIREPIFDETKITIIEVNGDEVYYTKDNTGNYYSFSYSNAEREFSVGETRTLVIYEGSEEIANIK